MKSFFEKRPCLSEQELRKYVNNELSSRQAHEVEAHLLDCPLCSAAVEGMTARSLTLKDALALKELKAEGFPFQKRPTRQRTWINYAAAILLFITGSVGFYQYRKATWHQSLFAAFYEPGQPDVLSLRGASVSGTSAIEPDLKAALSLYEDGDYEGSIVFFQRYINQFPGDLEVQLLFSSALLGNWETERAINVLHQLASTLADQSELNWLLVLAHIQNNELEMAAELLSQTTFQGVKADKAALLEVKLSTR